VSPFSQPHPNAKVLSIAYLVHLFVPLFFLLDVVAAWRFPSNIGSLAAPAQWWIDFGTTGQAVFVASVAWLVLGLALLALVQWIGMISWRRLEGPLIGFYAVLLTMLLAELVLNVFPGGAQKPALWPPGREALLQPDPKLMPGVEGTARFTGNDVGLRGPAYPADRNNIYKVVTIGGSTTESLYLDDSEEWPHLLMVGTPAGRTIRCGWQTVGRAAETWRTIWNSFEFYRSSTKCRCSSS